jgi:hypothetical protein
MLRAAKPYASRLFSYHTLAQLSDAEARLALAGPAALQGVELERGAIEAVVGESGGYPYFLQEYGRVLWDEIDEPPITAEHVRTVNEIVKDNLDRSFFSPAFELATDAEQRYLIAIANLGDGPYKTAEAAQAAGYASIGGASVVREVLIEKELIWSPRRGQIDFTVPRFAGYLRGSHG